MAERTVGEPSAAQRDAALMRRVAAGDGAAAREVVGHYLAPALGLARRILNDSAEAEDVAQEAMLRLWQMAARWRDDAPIGAWLYRVAHNLAIDRIRRRRGTTGLEAADAVPDPSPSPAENMAREQQAALVDAAIGRLPERQRAAITLVHHLEMGNIEAAAVMEISVEALESLLARARRSLRAELTELRKELVGE